MTDVSFIPHTPDLLKPLTDLIATHEEWLMAQVLEYADRQNFGNKDSSILKDLKIHISGLSALLLSTLHSPDRFPELQLNDDYTGDPIAAFGIREAQRPRARGVTLGMLLGLMKYYRRSWADLMLEANFPPEKKACFRNILDSFFDRVELGFCVEWNAQTEKLVAKRTTELRETHAVLQKQMEERKQAETANVELYQQLLHSQKMEAIGTMAGGIAHDFNNILSAILGFSELAQEMLSSDGNISDHLNEIITASLRAKQLVQQILTFSHKEDQQQKPVKLEIIVREVLKLFRAMIPAGIQIHQNIENDCGFVLMAPTFIHQILMNLCANAYHAMKDTGGMLSITLKAVMVEEEGKEKAFGVKSGPYLVLSVSDTGHGMDETVREKIFEPYFTTKKQGEGTGLGLSVLMGIIKRHRGYINVFSEPGKGTTFRIYLPRSTGEETAFETNAAEPVPRGSEHILIVDDEAVLVSMWQQHLELLGYKITACTNSQMALSHFKNHPEIFDLVLTDMNMPNITGSKLSRMMMAVRPDIPIILSTGYDEKITEKEAAALGIKAFILKPILIKDLAKTIRTVLEKKTFFPMSTKRPASPLP
jgi:signal transduction histidine kinase/ActR/RegA family two-component response regulator